MSSFILILFAFLVGYLFKRNKILPDTTPAVLNGFIIYLSLPAITLYHIHKIEFSMGMILPVMMPWFVFGLSFLFFSFLVKVGLLSIQTAGALILTCGLGNTSFVGFPLTEFFFGKDALPIAVLCDQPGTFTVLSSLGIATAAIYSSGKVTVSEITKKIFFFPPFITFLVALLLHGVMFPIWLDEILIKLGDTLTPVALVAVGFQIEPEKMIGQFVHVSIGLAFKLLLAPAAVYFILQFFVLKEDLVFQVTLLEAGMAPMITGGIIAARYGLNPTLVSAIVGFGIPVSFLTVYGWYMVMHL